jgi:hypothetical protein
MARAGAPPASALARAACLLLALAACTPRGEQAAVPGPLLPTLATRQDRVERLQLRGAGNRSLVTLSRAQGEWRVGERAGWPADGGRIARYLSQLAQARRVERKTDSASRYPRLGVEDIADPGATGVELRLDGPGIAQRLLLGHDHPRSGGRYVRANGEATSWRTDLDVGFERDPLAWIDHRLIEVPLARVERVRMRPQGRPAFALVHRDDRFGPDDAPPGAMHDSLAGDEVASALQAFDIEDVAADAGAAGRAASQELDYELVDGAVVGVVVWREGQRDWARLAASLDEARAAAWAAQTRRPDALADARASVRRWNRRFAGRRFLLPPALATTLTLDHSQILDGRAPGSRP